jgi:hypothetical protein
LVGHFNVFDSAFCFIPDAGGCIVVSGDGMLFLERSRYVGIVLLEKGLDLFFPFYGIIFLAVGDATGGSRSTLPTAGDDASGVRSYVRFNLQKIWPMCGWRKVMGHSPPSGTQSKPRETTWSRS